MRKMIEFVVRDSINERRNKKNIEGETIWEPLVCIQTVDLIESKRRQTQREYSTTNAHTNTKTNTFPMLSIHVSICNDDAIKNVNDTTTIKHN